MIDIRLARVEDGAALADIYRPAVAERATSFEVDPPDAAEMARRAEALLVRLPWLVCEEDGMVLGYAYASRHRDRAAYQWSVEVSAYVHEAAHRRGVGSGLYTSLFAALVLLGYRNTYAGITLPNDASVGLHEAVGFTRVGVYRDIGWKFGRWHDVLWLQRDLAAHVADPPPPQPLSQFLDRAVLDGALHAGLTRIRAAS
jgi:L-amino acid N-acyltransferase YncA